MKINYNMSAYVANTKLLQNESALTSSLEKLSSGYRINRASDDPAGMALSAKMKTQIRGLERASRNASDGISVIQTAEGALQEVTSMLQRMRELSVQAANGTNAEEDLDSIQKEIDALKSEIDRISSDTEFNKKTLLDGSLSSRVYANTRQVSLVEVSSTVNTGDYSMYATKDATRAVMTAKPANLDNYQVQDPNDPVATIPAIPEGQISINGVGVSFKGGETEAEVYTALRDACEKAGVNLVCYNGEANDIPSDADRRDNLETEGYIPKAGGYQFGDALAFVSQKTGKTEQITISCSDDNFAGFFGLTAAEQTRTGSDVEIKLTGDTFTRQATVLTSGNTVSITDRNGFSISFDLKEGGFFNDTDPDTGADVQSILLQVTDIGNMSLQVGANQYQTIDVDIPDMSTKALRIDDLDVTKASGPDKAIDALDKALEKVSNVRSSLGAAQNRLDYAVDSLDETDENMNAALSRIEDVDMASEMSTYTQMNVLVQAATSVLAQANDLPEQALQLLQ
ncbi:MAG: flagellin [Lachnospiraceae bacterium]